MNSICHKKMEDLNFPTLFLCRNLNIYQLFTAVICRWQNYTRHNNMNNLVITFRLYHAYFWSNMTSIEPTDLFTQYQKEIINVISLNRYLLIIL